MAHTSTEFIELALRSLSKSQGFPEGDPPVASPDAESAQVFATLALVETVHELIDEIREHRDS